MTCAKSQKEKREGICAMLPDMRKSMCACGRGTCVLREERDCERCVREMHLVLVYSSYFHFHLIILFI